MEKEKADIKCLRINTSPRSNELLKPTDLGRTFISVGNLNYSWYKIKLRHREKKALPKFNIFPAKI